MKFRDLGLDPGLASKMESLGFKDAFKVQESVIPHALKGKELAVRAKTGSGKTLAFGVPLAQLVKREGRVQAMVLTPTRELAIQIFDVLRKMSKGYIALVYGGVKYERQFEDLKKADIVVGTPGRIIDHINRGTLKAQPGFLVLDEADRMLDMGFIPDVRKIMRRCPPERVWLFSATLRGEITRLIEGRNFQVIEVGEEMPNLEHKYIEAERNKIGMLRKILPKDKTLVFCNTKRMTQRLGEILKVPMLHGDMSQAARERNLQRFRNGHNYLIATDVAARGIDIPEVGAVINFDLPKDGKDYVHRTGRTGRAGKTGHVINMLRGDDHDLFRRIVGELELDINRL